MAATKAVWGIEIGQCALKAAKLRPAENGKVELAAFDLIEHSKILSQPDAEVDELIKAALEKFTSRNDWQGDAFVIGVPGQQTFARFCPLPPVEAKKIPEIVRFEASQQIPFEMDAVVWDYQVFQAEDSPDVEVGIFAMRKDLIRKHLDYFSSFGIAPTAIQTVPSAMYNFCHFEQKDELEEGTGIVLIDVGTEHTDLIVVEPNSAWSRNIPLGGNTFTEALVKAFKLTFAKAESLKRSAATSKYARQIFQAMRPVFSDLVAEIQRSIGFYSATHRDVELKTVLACGNAFHLPGLQKYLENNLTIAGGVKRLEKFSQLITSATSNAPDFADNLASFGPAYGLALQGMGLSKISANLLPPELARAQLWKRKQWYFAAAAACIGLASTFPWLRNSMDSAALASASSLTDDARRIVNQARQFKTDYQNVKTDSGTQEAKIKQLFELQEKRSVLPRILDLVHKSMPEVDPALAAAQTPEDLKKLIKSDPVRYARTARGQIVIEQFQVTYSDDIDTLERKRLDVAGKSRVGSPGSGTSRFDPGRTMGPGSLGPGGPPPRPTSERPGKGGKQKSEPTTVGGFYVAIQGRLLYGESQSQAIQFITEEFYPRLMQLGQTPHMGFFIPENDPKSMAADQRNLNTPEINYYSGGPSAPAARSTGIPGGRRMGGLPAAGTPEPENTVQFPDPVTGEDMISDWVFQFGFKIKFGEPPAPEKKDADKTGDASKDGEP